MRKVGVVSLLLAVLSVLPACGSGGSSPIPQPSVNPSVQKIVGFNVTPLGAHTQSGNRIPQSATQTTTCGTGTGDSIVTQSLTGFNPGSANVLYFTGQLVQATEYNATCGVISTTPTFSGQSPNIAVVNSTTAVNTVLPSPPPGGTNLTGGIPGKANVVATFTDGTTATIPMTSYEEIAFACPQSNWYSQPANGQAGPGWSDSNSYNVTWGTNSNTNTIGCSGYFQQYPGDPQPDIFNDSSSSNASVYIPGGYDIVNTNAKPADLAAITSCSSFVSQGTTFTASSGASSGNVTGGFLMLFKTADGKCVKFLDLGMEPALVGLYEVSDTTGTFAY